MNEIWIQLFLAVYLVGLVWLAGAKAQEDGFFSSICTLAVLITAFTVADREWAAVVSFLRERMEVNMVASISAGFWIGFIAIVLPGMLFIRALAKERTPFPAPVERYGCMLAGGVAGMLVFVVTIQSVYLFEGVQNVIGGPLGVFHPLFHIFGSNWVPRA